MRQVNLANAYKTLQDGEFFFYRLMPATERWPYQLVVARETITASNETDFNRKLLEVIEAYSESLANSKYAIKILKEDDNYDLNIVYYGTAEEVESAAGIKWFTKLIGVPNWSVVQKTRDTLLKLAAKDLDNDSIYAINVAIDMIFSMQYIGAGYGGYSDDEVFPELDNNKSLTLDSCKGYTVWGRESGEDLGILAPGDDQPARLQILFNFAGFADMKVVHMAQLKDTLVITYNHLPIGGISETVICFTETNVF